MDLIVDSYKPWPLDRTEKNFPNLFLAAIDGIKT